MLEQTLLNSDSSVNACLNNIAHDGSSQSAMSDKVKVLLDTCLQNKPELNHHATEFTVMTSSSPKISTKSGLIKKQSPKQISQVDWSNNSRNLLKREVKQVLKEKCNGDRQSSKQKTANRFQIKPKVKKHLYESAEGNYLRKDQRYCENKPVLLNSEQVFRLGLYESGNRYKVKNICNQASKLKLLGVSPYLAPMKMCDRTELFLTNISPMSAAGFLMDQFHKKDAIVPIDQFTIEQVGEGQQRLTESDQTEVLKQHVLPEVKVEQSVYHLTVKDYELAHNEVYFKFKVRSIERWGQLSGLIHEILRYLRSLKINFFRIRTDRLNCFWDGKKLSAKDLNTLLNLKPVVKPIQTLQKLCLRIYDLAKVTRIRNQIQRKRQLALWIAVRLKTSYQIRKKREERLQRARLLLEEFKKRTIWNAQIYLPSFSQSPFKRSTTQYMESFESIFPNLWEEDNKTVILILPAVNEVLLKYFQAKFKLKKNISIICPDLHDVYPANLSLAASLYFSYEALARIKQIIRQKEAIIIPGRYDDPKYEMLLSDWLNAPLITSLGVDNRHSLQKQFFAASHIHTPVYSVVQQSVTAEKIYQSFASLILASEGEKEWVFKLNGEFGGRGIATFNTADGKNMKKIKLDLTKQDQLITYLKTTLKLKLKVNFENSLFMVDEYLTQVTQVGGIIEERIQDLAIYEICFKRIQDCQLLHAYRLYNVSYSNKIWVSAENLPSEVMQAIKSLQMNLCTSGYFGYFSVVLGQNQEGRVFGIDIKPYQTPSSSISAMIKLLDYGRAPTAQLSNALTIRSQQIDTQPHLEQFYYMFIPNVVLTDIDDEPKSKLIEVLMQECWNDRKINVHGDCRLYFSLGLTLCLLLVGRDMKKLKKQALEVVRDLADRSSALKTYKGKQEVRDVFQFGDIIRAVTQIKQEEDH